MSEFEYGRDENPLNDNEVSINENDVEVVGGAESTQTSETVDGRYSFRGDPYNNEESGRYRYGRQTNYSAGTGDTGHQNYYNSSSEEPNNRKRKRKSGNGNVPKTIGKLVGAALIFGVVAGVAFAGVNVARDRLYPSTSKKIETTTVQNNNSEDSSSTGTITAQDVSAIVDGVMPSVVSITSTVETSGYYGFGTQESQGAGSGFIIAKTDENLMIGTNNHVVADSKALTVGFADGTTADAAVVGTDTDADLAVIAVKLKDISDETASAIKIAVLGSSDSLKVGEAVIAIGNALGYGQSVTTGVISAKDREVSFTDGTMNLLQTDAAINPGNSGGVLVNLKGEVVGINNAKLADTDVEGMGYAIPISTAHTVLTDLMNAESISEDEAAYLGIVGKTLDSSYSQALGMPSGIYVSQVVSGSPAEEAGIAAGDIITGFEGNNVSTMDGLKEKLSIKKAGTKVKITLKRADQNGEYEEQTVKVTLGKKSDYEDATEESTQSEESNQNGNGYGGNSGNSGNGGYYYTNPYEYFFGNGSNGYGNGQYYNN